MYRTARTRSNGRYNLNGDINRIKSAVGIATKHAKGNATKAIYDQYDNLIDKSNDMQDQVINYTRKQPFKSLGIAALVGFILGWFFLLRK